MKHRSALGCLLGALAAASLAVLVPSSQLDPGQSRLATGILAAVFTIPIAILSLHLLHQARVNVRLDPRLRLVWLAAALFITGVLALNGFQARSAALRFQREGRHTTGTVLESHPEDHNTLLVDFQVDTSPYRLRLPAPGSARDFAAGVNLPVYFFASAPYDAMLEQPRWEPAEFICGWVLAAGLGPLWLVGMARWIPGPFRRGAI